jgi:uncharacterized surface protein with fasciclin (FAS1) repeats
MHTKYTLSITAIAAAVSLACGGAAFAQDRSPDELEMPGQDPAMTVDEAQRQLERETEDMNTTSQQSSNDMEMEEETSDRSMADSRDSDSGDSGSRDSDSKESKDYSMQSAENFNEELASKHDLGTFAKALEAAGLTNALTDGTSYTVFAPTDEAFSALDNDGKNLLDQDNIEELRKILRSHVVAGQVDAAQAKKLDSARVLTCATVALSTEDDKLKVADADVVESDIMAGNITIHSIDRVLDPDNASEFPSEDEVEAEE